MFRLLQAMFGRYATRHLTLTRHPATATRGTRIDSIALHAGRIVVNGHTAAEKVCLHLAGTVRATRPTGPPDSDGAIAFRLDMPWQDGPLTIEASGPGKDQVVISLPGLSPGRRALGLTALLPGFCWAGVRAVPAAWRWYRRHDPRARIEVKRLFGLDLYDPPVPLNPAWLGDPAPHVPPSETDATLPTFIRHDLPATPRLALALAWAAARCGDACVPVYLGHSLGGGADLDLQRRIAADLTGRGAAVVLRVGAHLRWRIEVHSPVGITCGGTDDTALMQRLMARLPRRDVIYSCGVGDVDPAALPDLLVGLAAGDAHRITVLLHDYLPISPAHTLVDGSGQYRGLPDPATDATLSDWQIKWGRLLGAAHHIVAFSTDSATLAGRAYPAVAGRIVVQPHALSATAGMLAIAPPDPGVPQVIGVLGNIGAHKGAAVVAALSRALARDRRAGLAIIGNLDPRFALAGPARVHGSYDVADIPALAARYGITCWLIPSIWPETFSFVTHEALATGLPVWAFDLGAQGAAVRAAVAGGAPGGVVPLDKAEVAAKTLIAAVLTDPIPPRAR